MKQARIGTMIKGNENPAQVIRSLSRHGFECWSLMFWESIGYTDLTALADNVVAAAAETGSCISSLSVYGNPLRGDAAGDETLRSFKALLEAAPAFCADSGLEPPVVSGFSGRVPGTAVPASIEAWKKIFAPLAERAEALGVRLAFENCRLGDTWKNGKWNIAINPDAWELMFKALPSDSIGLEWEPCHQVEAFCDPLAQLETWTPKIFHVHGKDARIDRAALAGHGLYGSERWSSSCFPGNGDTDWSAIFDTLKRKEYGGCVDIEGWNDSAWSAEKEIEGQVRALDYLRNCRA